MGTGVRDPSPSVYACESLSIFSSQDHCGGWRGLMMVSQVTGLAGKHIHLYKITSDDQGVRFRCS